jgi:hypothetical protein
VKELATTTFTFGDSEKTDIMLCARRNELYEMLCEIDTLRRDLYRSRTYKERYLYPVGFGEDEFNREVTEYSTIKPDVNSKPVRFIEVDYIVTYLDDITGSLKELLYIDCQ